MSKRNPPATPEVPGNRLGAEFDDAAAACRAADAVKSQARVPDNNIRVLGPDDLRAQGLLPASRVVARTSNRIRVITATAGVFTGMTLAGVALAAGMPAVVANPGVAYGIAGAAGLFGGLVWGHLATVRTNPDPVTRAAADSLTSGRWFVLVRTDEGDQQRAASKILRR